MYKDSRFKPNSIDEDNYRVIYPAVVIDNQDPDNAMRIKVRINDLREDIYLERDLPWCNPIIGKTFIELPKIGEVVMVILGNIIKPLSDRYWFPRQISSYEYLKEDYGIESAMRGTIHSAFGFSNKSFVNIAKARNLYPKKIDLNRTWLLGRNNVDISFGDIEYQLRVHKHFKDKSLERNTKNPYFFLVKNNSKDEIINTVISDKIVLISNKESLKPNYDSDLSIEKIDALFDDLYSLPRGEKLVEVLKILKNAILTHVHSYHLIPAQPAEQNTAKLINETFDILNKNIKIN